MKTNIVLLAIMAAAGVLASIAVAKPPPGHGHGHGLAGTTTTTTSATTGTTGTTTTTAVGGKVLVCHKVGNGHYVLLRVSVHSAHARGKHGDVLAVGGGCPGPTQGHEGGTTTQSTTTGTTTTTATTATTTTTS